MGPEFKPLEVLLELLAEALLEDLETDEAGQGAIGPVPRRARGRRAPKPRPATPK